jgi:DNA polymerase-3 subunit alpha
MGESGWSQGDLYVTALIKRPKEGKQVSAEEIRDYAPWLKEEIAILKPPVIIALGSATVRYFVAELKGKASEHAGKIVYLKEHDANLVLGFSPGEIYHDPEKGLLLEEVFEQAASLTTF